MTIPQLTSFDLGLRLAQTVRTGNGGATIATRSNTGLADRPDDISAGWGRSVSRGPHSAAASLLARVDAQPVLVLAGMAVLMISTVALLDYFTGFELSVSIFYLVPVVFAGWFLPRPVGVFFTFVCSALWIGIDMAAGLRYAGLSVPLWNSMFRFAFYIAALELVRRTREYSDHERALARTDSLTGVANGRSFGDRAGLALSRMARSGKPITLAYLDLDHFKEINDHLGHVEGDRVLRSVAQAVAKRLRATDLMARLGGDEFGILLEETGVDAAPTVLDSVIDAVASVVDGRWDVGCTIGAITFTEVPESVDQMVQLADGLMYRGKMAGRHRIVHEVWPS